MFINREANLANDANDILKGPSLRILLAITSSFEVGDVAHAADAIIVNGSGQLPKPPVEEGQGGIPRLAYLNNNPDNDALAAQLARLMESLPRGIVLGNTRNGSDLQRLDTLLSAEEAIRQLPVGQTAILAVVGDNPAGLLNAESFARRTPRLMGLGWNPKGLEQNGSAVGALRPAREMTLLAAANAGVSAFGWLEPELSGDALAEACARARQDGFAALVMSEPAQAAAIRATRDSDAATPEEAG
ncbi:hypothetical protein ACO34A_10685 [Rhizobium sp. ACO-34A]|nr:hypothetical protein [Rhizobium sp. ACO-34A]ATN34267.1 hypothetical protein ACO34A_10685 [Rhizobium sp. ACO-34A]